MAVAIGQNLPNLKITVGNDGRSSPPAEEENSSDVNEESEKMHDVEVVRKLVSPLESFRVYENKGGAFITGLDLSSEVVTKKLADRAARFGLEERPQNPITQAEIGALYKSLDIDPEHGKCKNIRLDALHVRGVEEMSTSDVIDYFKEYGPSSVEWINDFCCNVVWLDDAGAARALLGLSKVLVVKKKSTTSPRGEKKDQGTTQDENDATNKTDTEEVIFMSDLSSDDDDEEEDDKLVAFKHEKSGNPVDLDPETPMEIADDMPSKQDRSDLRVDVPVPPGHWRLGIPHAKAKTVLLRFATKDDKKLPGAEKRSYYYQKYGNPNYGGLRGLISKTRKRKFNITKQRQVVEQLSSHGNSDNIKAPVPAADHSRKRLRMRMHADDEEERMRVKSAKKQRTVQSVSTQRNVHDRLGNFVSRGRISDELERWSEDDILDQRTTSFNVKSTVSRPLSSKGQSSRFNVWTRLAESMAQESEVFESDYRTSPPKESRVGDLRNKLHSSSREDRTEKVTGDLRSKLEKLRRNEKPSKHRSPLLIEVDNQSDSDE